MDAWLIGHATPAEFPAYVALIKASGVRVVRERGVGAYRPDGTFSGETELKALKAAGLTVVCFASLPKGAGMEQPGDVLPENLLQVYENGKILGEKLTGWVDAWEMVGEPDIGYCRDLPDRLVAFQKAMYLGIKAGSERSPLRLPRRSEAKTGEQREDVRTVVAMGALGLPPGPWLERAVKNGLLDYTDAYNFHYYGRAEDFAGVIRAHRAVAGNALPLWVTECGDNTVSPRDFLNADRRRMQADFTVATARTARSEGLGLFMPFILFDKGDPYALTLAPDRPLPAWTAYADLTKKVPWPRAGARGGLGTGSVRRLFHALPGAATNPVVLQWMPDNTTTAPHKVSGTYRFRPGMDMRGELRMYNFGDKPVHGWLKLLVPGAVSGTFPVEKDFTLVPGSMAAVRGRFSPREAGYFQAWCEGEFESDGGGRSRLYFGLERTPVDGEFAERAVALKAVSPADHLPFEEYRVSSTAGPWTGINGVRAEPLSEGGTRFAVTEATGDPVGDPLYPPMAIAGVDGLPREGFLVVRTDPMVQAGSAVRVDLVDDAGQRFSIWENFGQSYVQPSDELWLNLRDFGPYFWGRCTERPVLHPEKVREIELRFYFGKPGQGMDVKIAVAAPGRAWNG